MNALAARLKARLKRHVYDALEERGLLSGLRIEFPGPGACRLQAFEEAGPGPGEILLETIVTIVSPGTERAVYLDLETADAAYPFVAGYCHSGRVALAGPGSHLAVGEVVATSGPHASLVACPERSAFRVPRGVSAEHAALTSLGFTALQGVRKAALGLGERVAVLGSGLVGLLAAQSARIAGGDVVVVARSPERLRIASACGLKTLQAQPRSSLDELRADVVIDATGDPQAVTDACRAARPGGRVVLLGSPRGVTRGLDVAALQEKGVELVGAHTHAVSQLDVAQQAWPRRRECELFLELLAQGRINVEPLITRRASPAEAPELYAALARPDDKSVAIALDWTRPGPWRARVQRPSVLRGLGRTARRMAGRAAGAAARSEPRSDRRRLRFGLIGCGEIAVESASALQASSNCAVVFAADPNLEAARSIAAGARFSADVDELLGSNEVDAVLISTPHHLHAPLAIQAALAGKHVVVEKPMATRLADCDRMIEAAERSRVALSVAYCHRYDPRVRRAKSLIEAGVVGQPAGTRIAFGQHRSAEYWSSGLSGRSTSDWRGRRETAGGGVLIMNACHLLDSMSWLVGSEVAEVAGCTSLQGHGVEVEDSVSMSYRYRNDALGNLEATTRLVGPGVFEQAIRGSEGQLVVAPTLRFWSRRTVEGYEGGRWHSVKDLAPSAERRAFFEGFADAVLDGRPPLVTAREARAVQATIEAAYSSADRRAAVSVASL